MKSSITYMKYMKVQIRFEEYLPFILSVQIEAPLVFEVWFSQLNEAQ